LSEVTEGAGHILDRLDDIGIALESGFRNRLLHIQDVGAEWHALRQTLSAGGHSLSFYLVMIAGTVLASLAIHKGIRRLLGQPVSWQSRFPFLRELAAALLTTMVVFLVLRIGLADGADRHIGRIWCFATIFSILVTKLLTRLIGKSPEGPQAQPGHLSAFSRLLIVGATWSLFGLATGATLRAWGAGSGVRDIAGTLLFGIPATVILVLAYWRHRRSVVQAVAGPEPWSTWRRRFAGAWPILAGIALIGTLLTLQIASTLERPLPGLAMLATLLLVLMAPHVDSAIAAWVLRKNEGSTGSLISAALRRMARFAFAALIIGLLAYLWALPALTAVGFDVGLIRTKAVEVVLVALVGAFLWNVTAAGTERLAHQQAGEPVNVTEEEAHAPQTRLATLLPLLSGTSKVTILVLTILTILIILDVNVWPLITGLSVFGLAIGFGSQTLVKDIVSGLFFLLDDAFRMGEYIETSGAKGTVERISIRSVSLRHPRGAIATIPYGQIGKIQNYSRDWVIEKMAFRVAFDTDVEKVRKLFKQIGQDIAQDPELSPDLLEPFKSQGIASVEDGTLVIRGKFKAKAGKQFGIRKAILAAVQTGFRDSGIRAVPKPMSVSDETARAQ
jgi:small-conductance mechanosensitive channel